MARTLAEIERDAYITDDQKLGEVIALAFEYEAENKRLNAVVSAMWEKVESAQTELGEIIEELHKNGRAD